MGRGCPFWGLGWHTRGGGSYMGMYTEVLIKADIRTDIDVVDRRALEFLFGGDEPSELVDPPEHRFFRTERWRCVGRMSSYYHVPWATRRFHEDCVFSRSDLKDYDGEVEAFFDWFAPLTCAFAGQCIGWHWYEEADVPTLVLKRDSDG